MKYMKYTAIAALSFGLFAATSSARAQDLCWGESGSEPDPCILRLNPVQSGSFFTINGRLECSDEEANVFGSGYVEGQYAKLGLTAIGAESDPTGQALFSDHFRMVINLASLNGTLYEQEEDPEDCAPGPAPCVEEEALVPVACP